MKYKNNNINDREAPINTFKTQRYNLGVPYENKSITMDSAKRLMQTLLDAKTAEDVNATLAELLVVFRQNPSFLSEKFFFRSAFVTPVHAFVLKGASLETTKSLCNIAPNELLRILAIRSSSVEDQRQGECPLHAALSNSSEELILFLARQQPKALTRNGLAKKSAIHCAMEAAAEGKLSLDTLQELVKLCKGVDTAAMLEFALEKALPLSIIDAIVGRKRVKALYLESNLNSDQIRIICKLIPNLQRFGLGSDWESNESFLRVLDEIKKAGKVNDLQLLTLPSLAGLNAQQERKIVKAIQDVMIGNSQLRNVRFRFSGHCTDACKITWARATLSSVHNMKKLRSFSLGGERQFYFCREEESIPYYVTSTNQLCLQMLDESNLTLTECSPWDRFDERVRYSLDLNRHGRALARNASANTMVQVLRPLAIRHAIGHDNDVDNLNAAYGLLRETPGSWCYGEKAPPSYMYLQPYAPSRKRKHECIMDSLTHCILWHKGKLHLLDD